MAGESIRDFDEEKAVELRSKYTDTYNKKLIKNSKKQRELENIANAAKVHYLDNEVAYKKAAKTEAVALGKMDRDDYSEIYVQEYADKLAEALGVVENYREGDPPVEVEIDGKRIQLVGFIRVGGGYGVVVSERSPDGDTHYWSVTNDGPGYSALIDEDEVDRKGGATHIYQLKPESMERVLHSVKCDTGSLKALGILEPLARVDEDILEADELHYRIGLVGNYELDESRLSRDVTKYWRAHNLGTDDIEGYASVMDEDHVEFVDRGEAGIHSEQAFAQHPVKIASYVLALAEILKGRDQGE